MASRASRASGRLAAKQEQACVARAAVFSHGVSITTGGEEAFGQYFLDHFDAAYDDSRAELSSTKKRKLKDEDEEGYKEELSDDELSDVESEPKDALDPGYDGKDGGMYSLIACIAYLFTALTTVMQDDSHAIPKGRKKKGLENMSEANQKLVTEAINTARKEGPAPTSWSKESFRAYICTNSVVYTIGWYSSAQDARDAQKIAKGILSPGKTRSLADNLVAFDHVSCPLCSHSTASMATLERHMCNAHKRPFDDSDQKSLMALLTPEKRKALTAQVSLALQGSGDMTKPSGDGRINEEFFPRLAREMTHLRARIVALSDEDVTESKRSALTRIRH